MQRVDSVLRSYVSLRRRQIKSLEALERLRTQIEPLQTAEKKQVVAGVRYYEKHICGKPEPVPARRSAKSISETDTDTVPRAPAPAQPYGDPTRQPTLCAKCSTLNWQGETTCHRCGQTLEDGTALNGTKTHRLEEFEVVRSDLFTPTSTLILRLPQHHDVIELHPQKMDRSLIFGRFDDRGGIIPDVDFTQYDGARFGVSRLHMALTYNQRHNQLKAKDMGSANGMTVNSQRLTPYEARVLQQGDRLELGRMVVQIIFVHE